LPSIQTSEFGQVTYDESEVFLFPDGIHGFEESKEYVLLRREGLAPFCFLQSISDGVLRFICLPARVIDAGFTVAIGDEDASELRIAAGIHVEVLAILTIPAEGLATANLFAPVVLVPSARLGRQCIQFGSDAPVAKEIPWMVRHKPEAVA